MKTLCGWCSGSGRPSPGQQLLWPHPGLRCETSSAGLGPDTAAASDQHCEESDILTRVFLHYSEINKPQMDSLVIAQNTLQGFGIF